MIKKTIQECVPVLRKRLEFAPSATLEFEELDFFPTEDAQKELRSLMDAIYVSYKSFTHVNRSQLKICFLDKTSLQTQYPTTSHQD